MRIRYSAIARPSSEGPLLGPLTKTTNEPRPDRQIVAEFSGHDARMRLSTNEVHFAWDNSLPPALTVDPGERVELDTLDASAGQLTSSSTARDISAIDFARVNPVTGPISVNGAQPGDALV